MFGREARKINIKNNLQNFKLVGYTTIDIEAINMFLREIAYRYAIHCD